MTETPKVGVAVLLFKEDKEPRIGELLAEKGYNIHLSILLGKRIGDHGGEKWCVPGGHVEVMEHPIKTCVRETKEETNLDISHVKRLNLQYTNDFFKETGKHYITLWFTGIVEPTSELKNVEKDKFEKWEWFPLDELPSPIFLLPGNILGNRDFQEEMMEIIKKKKEKDNANKNSI